MSSQSVILLYRDTCAKCRVLSLLLVWCSLGWVQRVPQRSPEARAVCEAYSIPPGKLALAGYRRVFTGWRAFPGVAALAAVAIWSRWGNRQT